jgi:hypothetical protein
MMPSALVLAFANAGSSRAARMAMMAMTTSNSMRVKPRRVEREAGRFLSLFGAD